MTRPLSQTGTLQKTGEAAAFASLTSLRRRDMPGYKALPTLMGTPPTISQGAAGGATQITGSILIAPWETEAFTYYGTVPAYGGTSYPGSSFFTSNGAGGVAGVYTSGSTTNSPWAVEFDFDTTDGKFEVMFKGTGSGGGVRVLVNGQYATQGNTFVSATSDGQIYLGLVTLAAAGIYRIRLEGEGSFWFGGIRTIVGNAVNATPKKSQRWIVLGDSITEPTITDTATTKQGWDGWVQQLSYILGVDAWSCGAGGTGYLQTFASPARTNFLNRINDVIRNSPDVVVFAGGINDYANFTAAAIGAQAFACFQAVRAALPNTQIIVLSPFWRDGAQSYAANLLCTADAIKAAAQQVGAVFLDLLRFPVPTQGANGGPAPAATALAAAAAVSATSISTNANLPLNTYMQIGTDANAEVRKVTGSSGTGPYTLSFGGALPSGGGGNLARAHNAGDPIIPVGYGFLSGTGNQGSLQNDGTADRFVGNDATHPTTAGHKNIARNVHAILSTLVAP